jgi:hypothetical protein
MAVKGSTLFNGQYVFGVTSGAPLSTNANGGLVSGITNSEVSATSAATTTSTTDVLMTTMTITPVAGTYLVVFSGWFTQSAGGDQIIFSIYVGGTQKADSIRNIQPFSSSAFGANQNTAAATNGIVTVNGSQAIAIEWHVSAGTGTVTNRTLDIVRLA